MRESGLRTQPVGVVPGAGQQLPGDVDTDAGQREQARRGRRHQCPQLGVRLGSLLGEVLMAAGEAAQRGLGRLLRVGELTTLT